MHWNQLIGHEQPRAWFDNAMSQGRLATSFLFIGREGIGKRTFARMLAQSLLCRNAPPGSLEACGRCEDCAQVRAGTHPDLKEIAKPEEKSEFPLELLIGRKENRMREGLCYEISLRPYAGRRKVAIIDDADSFNAESANALLKTLEEPPPDSVLILIGTSLHRQLPTIRSRCQTVLFSPLSTEELTQLILRVGLSEEVEAATRLALASRGSITEAALRNDVALQEFRSWLLSDLAKRPLNLGGIADACAKQADAAGKEARLKRQRIKLILREAGLLYQQIAFRQLGATDTGTDPHLQTSIERCLEHWTQGVQGALACWQICLRAIEQVDRNANQATLLHFWSSELARQSNA